MPDLEIIARDSVIWTTNCFEPFKSPGPEGIFPALLYHAGDILHKYLVDVHRDCFRWCNIPDGWKNVLVVFLPRAGKPSHIGPKDYRPI